MRMCILTSEERVWGVGGWRLEAAEEVWMSAATLDTMGRPHCPWRASQPESGGPHNLLYEEGPGGTPCIEVPRIVISRGTLVRLKDRGVDERGQPRHHGSAPT